MVTTLVPLERVFRVQPIVGISWENMAEIRKVGHDWKLEKLALKNSGEILPVWLLITVNLIGNIWYL